MKKNHSSNFVLQDLGIVILSILVALILVKTNLIVQLIGSAQNLELIGSFVAGMFFTSIFTTAPAIAALGEISLLQGIFSTALVGAVGSVVGDLLIFTFVKDRVSQHVSELLAHTRMSKRFRVVFRRRLFRWFTFFIGGLILASPLPDELGVSLLGLSKMRFKYFIALSFVFNFLGILAIGLITRALV